MWIRREAERVRSLESIEGKYEAKTYPEFSTSATTCTRPRQQRRGSCRLKGMSLGLLGANDIVVCL